MARKKIVLTADNVLMTEERAVSRKSQSTGSLRKCVAHHHACDCRERQFDNLVCAMRELLDEYDDRESQFGDDCLWKKHEDKDTIETARQILADWDEANKRI